MDSWCPRDHCRVETSGDLAQTSLEQCEDHTCENNHKVNLDLFK